MKYIQHYTSSFGVKTTEFFKPEGTHICIPESDDNADYLRMIAEVEAGTSTIESGPTIVMFEQATIKDANSKS